jgi:hypothetical protein
MAAGALICRQGKTAAAFAGPGDQGRKTCSTWLPPSVKEKNGFDI